MLSEKEKGTLANALSMGIDCFTGCSQEALELSAPIRASMHAMMQDLQDCEHCGRKRDYHADGCITQEVRVYKKTRGKQILGYVVGASKQQVRDAITKGLGFRWGDGANFVGQQPIQEEEHNDMWISYFSLYQGYTSRDDLDRLQHFMNEK